MREKKLRMSSGSFFTGKAAFIAGIVVALGAFLFFSRDGELRWVFQAHDIPFVRQTGLVKNEDEADSLLHDTIATSLLNPDTLEQSEPSSDQTSESVGKEDTRTSTDPRVTQTEAQPDDKPKNALPVPTPQPTTHQSPVVVLPTTDELNEKARAASVNILCTTTAGGSFRPITATGIFIDARGIILTNAHVAQYLLLARYVNDGAIDCVIRTGSPAQTRYRADVLYISPRWITNNSRTLIDRNPLGTGEYDYALLVVTQTSNPSAKLPGRFPALPLEHTEDPSLSTDDVILITGYPAGFLGGISVQKDLYLASTVSRIGQLFTFQEGTIDLFSAGGTVLSQKGASGGAVVRQQTGRLTGMVVTSSDGPTTGERDLRAISIDHINRSFAEETGVSLMSFLKQDYKQFHQSFNTEKAPELADILIKAIRESED